ncbi:hypothetical protein ACTFIY_009594 [Dictyostelium cf. discoideum]
MLWMITFTNRYEELYQERYPTQAPLNPNANRENVSKHYNVLQLCMWLYQIVLSLYIWKCYGLSRYWHCANILKVMLYHASYFMFRISCYLSDYKWKYTLRWGHSFKITVLKREIVRDIKREINLRCFQAKVQTATTAPSSVLKKSYKLRMIKLLHMNLTSPST